MEDDGALGGQHDGLGDAGQRRSAPRTRARTAGCPSRSAASRSARPGRAAPRPPGPRPARGRRAGRRSSPSAASSATRAATAAGLVSDRPPAPARIGSPSGALPTREHERAAPRRASRRRRRGSARCSCRAAAARAAGRRRGCASPGAVRGAPVSIRWPSRVHDAHVGAVERSARGSENRSTTDGDLLDHRALPARRAWSRAAWRAPAPGAGASRRAGPARPAERQQAPRSARAASCRQPRADAGRGPPPTLRASGALRRRSAAAGARERRPAPPRRSRRDRERRRRRRDGDLVHVVAPVAAGARLELDVRLEGGALMHVGAGRRARSRRRAGPARARRAARRRRAPSATSTASRRQRAAQRRVRRGRSATHGEHQARGGRGAAHTAGAGGAPGALGVGQPPDVRHARGSAQPASTSDARRGDRGRHSRRGRRPRAPLPAPTPSATHSAIAATDSTAETPSLGAAAGRSERLDQRDARQAGRRRRAQRGLAAASARRRSAIVRASSELGAGALTGMISQPNIMLWSSWARLWQCATYGPAKVRNRREITTSSLGSSATTSSLPVSSGWRASGAGLPLRATTRCSSMWRCNGCTQPPPPLRIRHRPRRVLLDARSAAWSGSNGWPLISHSVSGSPCELPRCSSNVGMLLSLIGRERAGRRGRARRAAWPG